MCTLRPEVKGREEREHIKAQRKVQEIEKKHGQQNEGIIRMKIP
jgi:hypothetical protein